MLRLLAILILAAASPALAWAKHGHYHGRKAVHYKSAVQVRPLDLYEVKLVYSKTGATGEQIKKIFHADLVYPAGYFNPVYGKLAAAHNGHRTKKSPFCAADLLCISGSLLNDYQDLDRPVVVLDSSNAYVGIKGPDGFEKARTEAEAKAEAIDAFAANDKIIDPDEVKIRPFLATVARRDKHGKYVLNLVTGYVQGTAKVCLPAIRKLKAKYHFKEFVWLDGGSAFPNTNVRPFHLVVRRRKH